MAPELAHTFSRVSLGPKRARLEDETVFDASSSGANPDRARAAASHSLTIYITLLIRVKIKIWIIKRAGVIQCNNSIGTHCRWLTKRARVSSIVNERSTMDTTVKGNIVFLLPTRRFGETTV